jgi:hypothetical protein
MSWIEPTIGYVASALVLATFCMRDMATLRCVAIASNLAFITYGAMAGLGPVLVLHLLLLPVNVWRLTVRRASAGDSARAEISFCRVSRFDCEAVGRRQESKGRR